MRIALATMRSHALPIFLRKIFHFEKYFIGAQKNIQEYFSSAVFLKPRCIQMHVHAKKFVLKQKIAHTTYRFFLKIFSFDTPQGQHRGALLHCPCINRKPEGCQVIE